MEVWKPVLGFEDYYSVSSEGRVKSLTRTIVSKSRWGSLYTRTVPEKIMSPVDNGTGYLQVRLEVNGNKVAKYVHRLVAEAFLKKPRDDLEVDHLDSDKTNNSASNLAWVTRLENMSKCFAENPHILHNFCNNR